MGVESLEFLSVRDAARALQVHENTIRNWVKEGRLADARLPGSRYLRLERSAVERLRKQRGRTVPSLKAERLTVNPELANAGQLRRWALDSSRDAQQNLPELVRRLLVESPGISGVSMRSGDGISLPGWDGLADSDGSASYLPSGQLRFEIGVAKGVQAKAESDYTNRVAEQPAGKVFVFVTPHRWARKEEWAASKRAERLFADVRVLDADDLEGWLKAAPASHYWISEHLGLSPRHAQTLEARWNRFSSGHDPALPSDLFIAGREAQVEALRTRLSSTTAQLTTIQAEWVNDCLGFVYAALTDLPEQPPRLEVPVLLVDSEEVWDRVIEQAGRAILVPTFDSADVGRALDRNHHVISLVDKTAVSRRAIDISLPRPSRPAASAALESAGLDFREAQRLALMARRSMPAMARSLSRNPTFTRPAWSHAPDALRYSLLVITGSWKSQDSDRAFVSTLTGCQLEEIDRLVEAAIDRPDPLFRRTGATVMVASPEEAFSLLKESLRAPSLQTWFEAAIALLLEPDPAMELPAEERHLAALRGLKRRHSTDLTRGVAQGFALLGTMGEGTPPGAQSTVAEMTSQAVRRLLRSALSDSTGRALHLVASVLPLLAEAAPDEFLAAINGSLDEPDPVILTLFQEVEGQLALGPSSPHPHLLWALETLCWSREHLVEAVRTLARLAANEPGGKSGNRPSSSLATVLAGWIRHTSADFETKIRALDAVLAVDNAVGWKLLRDLWPKNHAWAMPPASPRFREAWAPSETAVPIREWLEFVHKLVDRAIVHAGTSPDRLAELVDMLSAVPTSDREQLMAHLESLATYTELDGEARSRLWEQLEQTVARHRRFSTAAWAMDTSALDRLKMLADAIEPVSDPSRLAFLFDWHPELEGVPVSDFETYQLRLREARGDAVREILEGDGWRDTLAAVARKAKAPSQLGWLLAERDQLTTQDLLPWLVSDEPCLRDMAMRVVERRLQLRGPLYLEDLLRLDELHGEARTQVLRAVPPNKQFWDVLDRSPKPDDIDTYWLCAPIEVVPVPDSAHAITQLSERGRAWAAIAVASYALTQAASDGHTTADGLTAESVVELLNKALLQRPSEGELGQMTSHYLGELLDFLDRAADVDDSVLARFEFNFFRLLEYSRQPVALTRVLATNPDFFVDLVKLAFRAKNEPRRDLSTAESELAAHAYSVLNGWRGYPGRSEDGQFDPDRLMTWVVSARLLLSESGRADVGDEIIGESFAYSPAGEDGVWPAEPVRDLIERIGSQELENGFLIGRLNSRGVTTRGVYDGGQQERDLAAQYRAWSTAAASKWPRTARILRGIADSYERDARREDAEAELDADRD